MTDPIILEAVVDTILSYVHPVRIILFGSRVSGGGHEYSDYDIAIEGVRLDIATSRLLKEAIDAKVGIYSVDLVELDRLDDGFRELVRNDGVVLYEAD
ncbi:MAG: nucleotidyltransferase domain-containing protein [Nitrospirae bacterium]|nr:nucleotidyltransferase domain-containing protein [Nitrospirota bacterium]